MFFVKNHNGSVKKTYQFVFFATMIPPKSKKRKNRRAVMSTRPGTGHGPADENGRSMQSKDF